MKISMAPLGPCARILILWIIIISGGTVLFAQESARKDSAELLREVVVQAYEHHRGLRDLPAAVSVVPKGALERFSPTSLVPAFNSNPGVRMEERSPGSYRLNIRGSSLRSPFGVRNVKVYYNGIPYTDPGGNTFFNQLAFSQIGRVEIIRGPGSSLYGAGTGGVILLHSNDSAFNRGAALQYTGGSFGSHHVQINLRGGSQQLQHSLNVQAQQSEGFRDHTRMERRVISWDGLARVGEKGTLRAHFFQGDLYYETPGALTAAEYAENPRAARPRVGQSPGSEEAGAGIRQKIVLAGLHYELRWNDRWSSTAAFYGAYTHLVNPTIRNYERRTEPHFGSRNLIRYRNRIGNSNLRLLGGVELQQGYSASKVYAYNGGAPGALDTDDELINRQYSAFAQAELETPQGWLFSAGASFNLLDLELTRLSDPVSEQKKRYHNQVAPRLAVVRRLHPALSVYGQVAKGFSPPTNAELLPSTGIISTGLEAETGHNLEVGARGSLGRRISYDISAFLFRLQNTIVQRRDQAGADYFVNAGRTRQAGIETQVLARLTEPDNRTFNKAHFWVGHTWHHFRYADFIRIGADTSDFSGKALPSIPPHFLAAGLDLVTRAGWYANLVHHYSDPLPLNDANTVFAESYHLAMARLGWRRLIRPDLLLDCYGTVDNIFDVQYSLGNDINAFGGRYFNAAPGRNFSAGVHLRYTW